MKQQKQIKVRVLVECAIGKPNDVIEIDAATLEAYSDCVDPHPASVKYAESLRD